MKPRLRVIDNKPDRNLDLDFKRIRKEINFQRVSDKTIQEEASKSRVNESIKPGRYFKPKKPFTVPADQLKTLDNFVDLVDNFPINLEPKYNGVACYISKWDGNVEILSDDGGDLTEDLPKIVEQIKQLDGSFVVGAELELWLDGQHMPRSETNGIIHKEDENDDDIVANIFDLFYFNEDIHMKPHFERRKILEENFDLQSTAKEPDEDEPNLSPYKRCNNKKELRKEASKIMENETKEGVVAKANEPYALKSDIPVFWKHHRVAVIDGIVLKPHETKTKGVYNYEWGVEHNLDLKPEESEELDDTLYSIMGKTFSTDLALERGDDIFVEIEELTIYQDDNSYRLSAYGPRVVNKVGEFNARKKLGIYQD